MAKTKTETEISEENGFYQFNGTDGYIASRALVEAVNCSIALERPLLIIRLIRRPSPRGRSTERSISRASC